MKETLYKLFEHRPLDRDAARDLMVRMARGEYNESQTAALITVWLMRSITVDELAGFRDALREMRVPVDLAEYDPIDIVGTGGDGKDTFNISTAACFVTAGAGYNVVKHGNYGSSSVSGASNVLEQHGVRFRDDVAAMRRSLDGAGIAYLHAPLFNPALGVVAPVRRALGVRTFFNMLGPLANPVSPRRQMLGVYNLKLARMYHYLYQQTDVEFAVVTSLDGYDEISLTADFKVFTPAGESIHAPEDLGFARARQSDLHGGGSVAEAAAIFDSVLDGTAPPPRIDCVVANAAFAIRTAAPAMPLADAVAAARESVESGRAMETFRKFVELNS
ncbi:MAG: anthranilate phosphoribosyltransferase [Alistipes sp.]|nr:anthranilate phosphoribosyltransferase [Alistipes sp.]